MIHLHELPLLLAAARDGLLDPARTAALAGEWNPAVHPRLTEFLVARGQLDPDVVRRLDAEAGTVEHSTPRRAADVDDTPTLAPAAAAGPSVGDIGSRYRLERMHRGGGLGQVWEGHDPLFGRRVAVKVLRPDRLRLPDVAQRFQAEAKAAGRLEHPNIVPVYDLIPPGDGRQAAYVMRFVAGKTLAEAAREFHAQPPADPDPRVALAPLLDAFVLVCRAVAFAHSRGVLHRDLKGANVILGEFGEVHLLDWGLAKPTVGGGGDAPVVAPEDSDLTMTNGIVGTPAYLAPEVAGGIDHSPVTDVYGLGATLFHLLTGKPPADGPTPQAILDKVRDFPLPPPHEVNPKVPAALDAIARKAMSRDPATRYQSADELAKDVRAWLADEPVAAHPDGRMERAARWGRRHRPAAVAAGLGLLATTLALAVGAGLLVREGRKTAVAARQAEDGYTSARALAAGLVDSLVRTVPGGRTVDPAKQRVFEQALAGFEELARQRPDRPPVELDLPLLRRFAGVAARNRYEFTRAEANFRRAAELAPPPDASPYEPAELAAELAGVLQKLGRLKEAEAVLAAAVAALPPADPSPQASRTLGRLRHAQAAVADDRHQRAEAAAYAREAADLFDLVGKLPAGERHPYDPVYRAMALNLLASQQRETDQLRDAHKNHYDAVELMKAARKAAGVQTNDADHILAMCILNKARTPLLAGAKTTPADVANNLTGTITSWGQLAKEFADYPIYQEWLAVAHTRRAALTKTDTPDAARADLGRAAVLLEPLAAAHPEAASLHAGLGAVYALQAELTPGQRADRRAAARKAYDDALKRSPDARGYQVSRERLAGD